MAVNFVARKCACGGTLEFDSLKKIWICKYCGTVIEREATFDKIQVDGIEGINDVVRQTLMDISNKQIESAKHNLEDCERKNHKHIGTLLANLSFYLMNISVAKSQSEAGAALDKVKIYTKRLNDDFPVISEEEINLYEAFGDDASDIYGNLLVVFDTINDKGRMEYVSSKLKADQIFSKHTNNSLLKVAIKQRKYDVAEAIINNVNHIDKKTALKELLNNYPDDEQKILLIEKVLDNNVANQLQGKYFENYFINSNDSIKTKNYVIRKLSSTELYYNKAEVVKALSLQIDSYTLAKDTFLSLYESNINDQETEEIMLFTLIENKNYDVLKAFIDVLLEKQVFVVLDSKVIILFLDSDSLAMKQKEEILNKLFQFEINGKSKDIVYNYYLNSNKASMEERILIISFLLKKNCPISTSTITNYVVKTQIDGENKLEIVKKIFDTGFNKTYVGDLLSEYLLESNDPEKIKMQISDYLISIGFKIDSNVLNQYIISEAEEINVKIEKIKKLIENGTRAKADCLENYILSLKESNDFSEKMFNFLSNYSFAIGFFAYAKYILSCDDMDKVRHNKILLDNLSCELNGQSVTIKHLDNDIVCNLLQGYVLYNNESYEIKKSIVDDLLNQKMKLNTEISVNGDTMKFKKYVSENKSALSSVTLLLCEENRMFSLF